MRQRERWEEGGQCRSCEWSWPALGHCEGGVGTKKAADASVSCCGGCGACVGCERCDCNDSDQEDCFKANAKAKAKQAYCRVRSILPSRSYLQQPQQFQQSSWLGCGLNKKTCLPGPSKLSELELVREAPAENSQEIHHPYTILTKSLRPSSQPASW